MTWIPEACTLPTVERPLRVAEFDVLFAGATRAPQRPARSHRGPRPGLRERALDKIAEVDARIAQLQQVRETLAQVVAAGCTDLAACSCLPGCPLPFTGVLDTADSAHRGGR